MKQKSALVRFLIVLVGIISHVAELRSEIDKQLVVTKEKSGGSKVELKLN